MICVNTKLGKVKDSADDLYSELTNAGYEVLYDDRDDLSPGFKFNDADLLGIPLQLIVSEKNLKNGEVEIKLRRSGERIKINSKEAIKNIPKFLT